MAEALVQDYPEVLAYLPPICQSPASHLWPVAVTAATAAEAVMAPMARPIQQKYSIDMNTASLAPKFNPSAIMEKLSKAVMAAEEATAATAVCQ